jgi:hypothetical protein
MRTTLTLEDDVAQAAQSLARASGRSFGQVVSELMRRGLQSGSIKRSGKGVPTFAVDRHEEIIPSDRAATMLADEP